MEFRDSRRTIIVSQDGLVDYYIRQLSPAISNARLTLQVLKIVPITSTNKGITRLSTMIIARDIESLVQIFVWEFYNVVKANNLNLYNMIEIQYPDVRYRKSSSTPFPGTFEYELHIGDSSAAEGRTGDRKASLNLLPTELGFSVSLVTSFSHVPDVCNHECINSVVTVGSIIVALGEKKVSSRRANSDHAGASSRGEEQYYRTYRLWHPKTEVGYVNLTIWGSDSEFFQNVAKVGEMVVCERVKVISFRGTIQLASMHHSLYHLDINTPQTDAIRSEYASQQISLEKAISSAPALHRGNFKLKPTPNDTNIKLQENQEFKSSSSQRGNKGGREENKNSKITDFFQPAKDVATTPKISSSTPHSTTTIPIIKVAMEQLGAQKDTVFVRVKFSVQDAIELRDGEACIIVACLADILARSPRGWCIFNCATCSRPGASCTCSNFLKSCTWSYDITVVWRDIANTIPIDLTSTQAATLLGAEAAAFVDMEDDRKYMIVEGLFGRTFKITVAMTRGVRYLKDILELPMED